MDQLVQAINNLISENQRIQREHQEELREQKEEMKTLIKSLADSKLTPPGRPVFTIEALAKSFEQFHHDPARGGTFRAWYSRYEGIFSRETNDLDDAGKVRLVMRKLETPDYDRFNNHLAPEKAEEIPFVQLIERLKNYFDVEESLFSKRFNCLQVERGQQESLRDFSGRVNKLGEDFELGKLTKDQFKSLLFILGLKQPTDTELRTRLLTMYQREEGITFAQMQAEATAVLGAQKDATLGIVEPHVMRVSQNQSHPQQGHKTPSYPCWNCGGVHFVKDCPFVDHKCTTCRKIGHKEGYCALQKEKAPKQSNKAQRTNKKPGDRFKKRENNKPRILHVGDDNQNIAVLCVNDICQSSKQSNAKRKYVDVQINGSPVQLQYDSGADFTIISTRAWEAIGKPTLRPTALALNDANGNPFQMLGEAIVPVELQGFPVKNLRIVVTSASCDLLGIEWLDAFGLWDVPAAQFCNNVRQCSPFATEFAVSSIKNEFEEVFRPSMGCCPHIKGTLTLEDGARPVFRPKRTVPFPLLPDVDAELERLEQSGIISPVQFSSFAAPIVIVRKPTGAIRICGDYSTGLNAVLRQHHYPVPSPDALFASLAGTSIFSKLDLSDAYLQLEMDEDSKKLLTIHTHRGLFTFNRLCPGVKVASAIFQQAVDQMLSGIPNVISYCDDLLIASKDPHDHLHTIRQVLTRLKEFNFRARADKCSFFLKEVKYLGVIIDADGQRPDPEKTRSIVGMPPPSNINEVRAFLGAVGFYAKFIKSMSDIREPLDALLKKDAKFIWDDGCQKAFDKFKDILTSSLALGHYDVSQAVTIASDASQFGIGAVAYHQNGESFMAFHYASRKLTPTERRYSQIEKEALGIIYAVSKFRQYILGRKFFLLTDHKPLLAIFGDSKGVPGHVANRLRRWALTLAAYDFEISFVGTKDFGHADLLSRLIKEGADDGDLVIAEVHEDQAAVMEIQTALPVTFEQIKEATQRDATLNQVRGFIEDGWPTHKKLANNREVSHYWNSRNSLSLIDSCIRFRDRMVVPPPHRQAILASLHSGHPGIGRMKALARQYIYWPRMDEAIEAIARKCQACAAAAKAPTKVPLAAWPTPAGPWERVHADYAGPVNGQMYLIMVDAFSRWPEVVRMSRATTETTITAIGSACARLGVMETLVTDNGTPFTSAAFEQFLANNAIKHRRSPPYHPQSNGLAERFVDTFKRALGKSLDDIDDGIRQFLMAYRATPNERAPGGKSPAELMLGRRIRIPLASVQPPRNPTNARDTKMEQQFNEKHGARQRSFRGGEEVYAQTGPRAKWAHGRIIRPIGRVLYEVDLGDGRSRRFHANQLRQRKSMPLDFLTDVRPAPATVPVAAPIPAAVQQRGTKRCQRSSPPVLRPRPTKRTRLP